jgi:hypothetical protein
VGHRAIFGVKNHQHTKEMHPMTLAQSDLSELLDAIRAGGDVDLIREAVACPYLVAGALSVTEPLRPP